MTIHTADREEMLRTIAAECLYTRGLTGIATISAQVLAAMGKVAREEFVPPAFRPNAYDNSPLPIGSGQTISQPFIVALMTDLLLPEATDVILEIGAGSGYQAAILAELVKTVHTIEIIPELAHAAAARLARLGYENVAVQEGDGYQGLADHAPYDGIIVTAAAPHIPPPLIAQLKPGARLVIPVGLPHSVQELMVVSKDRHGKIGEENVLAVAFVPLTGAAQRGGRRPEAE
ncbi:MAG: protein-L-isoaspartate(D-aspartate) O-methyltransferase [Thermodesulfobacteriota bacterium]